MPQIKRKESKKDSLKRNGLKNGALLRSLQKGSLTVETALVLPWFLFAMVTVLYLFRVMQIQYMVGDALDKAVAETALVRETTPEKAENSVKLLFYKELVANQCPISMINLGMAGFIWDDSDKNEEYLNVEVNYQIKMPGWLLKSNMLQVTETSRCRRWTGIPGSGSNQSFGEWVYITPEGSVYHRSRECTHLKLSIHSVTAKAAEGYRPCELCAKGEKITAVVYITEEGECYHTKLNCSGLKRTIYMVPLTQVKRWSPCSRCGGK